MIFWVFLFLLFPFSIGAEVWNEQFIPLEAHAGFIHQGLLLDSEGVPLGEEGTEFCFKFSFYDDETVGSPDTKLWPRGESVPTVIMVKKGFFSVDIGKRNPDEQLNLPREDNANLFLQMEVANKVGSSCADNDEEFETLEPRQKIFLPTAPGCACTLLPLDNLREENTDEGERQCKAKTLVLEQDGRIYLPEGRNQMSGSGEILPGESEVFISNNKIDWSSKIIVTPLRALSAPLYIKEKRVGEGFSVAVAFTHLSEINFDWIVFHTMESTGSQQLTVNSSQDIDGGSTGLTMDGGGQPVVNIDGGGDQPTVTFDGGANGPPIDGGAGSGSSTLLTLPEETDLANLNESSSSTPVTREEDELQPEPSIEQTLEQ